MSLRLDMQHSEPLREPAKYYFEDSGWQSSFVIAKDMGRNARGERCICAYLSEGRSRRSSKLYLDDERDLGNLNRTIIAYRWHFTGAYKPSPSNGHGVLRQECGEASWRMLKSPWADHSSLSVNTWMQSIVHGINEKIVIMVF